MIELHFDFADEERADAFPLAEARLTDDATEAISQIVAWENLGEVAWGAMHIVRAGHRSTKRIATVTDRIPARWWDVIERNLERGPVAMLVMGMWGQDAVCIVVGVE